MSLAHSIKTVATFLMSVSQLCARIMERIICFAVMSCKWVERENMAIWIVVIKGIINDTLFRQVHEWSEWEKEQLSFYFIYTVF